MHSENLDTSNTTTDAAWGDPQLDRFYINMTPNAVTSLITRDDSTPRPALRDECAFRRRGPVAKRLPPDANRWKRLLETID